MPTYEEMITGGPFMGVPPQGASMDPAQSGAFRAMLADLAARWMPEYLRAPPVRDMPAEPGKVPRASIDWSVAAPFGAMEAASLFSPGGAAKAAIPFMGVAASRAQLAKALQEGTPILGQLPETTTRAILRNIRTKGGESVHVMTGERPETGLFVGKYPNLDPRTTVVPSEELTGKMLEQHARTNMPAWSQPDIYFGGWANPKDLQTYLDVTRRFEPEQVRQATKFGERSGQLELYNKGTGSTLPVGKWPEFVASPEFRQRTEQMAQVGSDYMAQFPTAKWWSPVGEQYAPEMRPFHAGFMASTAPNQNPTRNVQIASEYTRRQIMGEPIIQPEYRTPPGLMSHLEGKQMPLERSYAPNLERVARGELPSGRKVSREALALTGDPNAIPVDRHHVRLTEDPARGIFASTEEGVIGSTKNHILVEERLTDIARSLGQEPRDYSARVWAGIRETIKSTNELFGQKHKGGALQGPSKSYADIEQDLIADKAKFLKISVPEMKRRLERGDVNLMSILLATPAVAAVYRQWEEVASPASASEPGASSRP